MIRKRQGGAVLIETVLGKKDVSDINRCLMHEHFLFGFCGFQGDMSLGMFDEEKSLVICKEELKKATDYGVNTIVDATTNECGRNVRFLQRLSRETGVNIICSTGYYYEEESAFAYWKFRQKFTNIEDEIFEMYVQELTKGIEGTDIKAGVIKLASSKGRITEIEEAFFNAAARAQKETGAVIITHTQGGTMGKEQAQLLIGKGADKNKIAIGHMCGNTDIEYHKSVLEQGVYVNLDRFGLQGKLFGTPTDEERVDLIEKLIALGYEDKILVGHDTVNVQLGRPNVMNDIMKEAMKDANLATLGKKVIPIMKQRKIDDIIIDKIFSENPKNIFR